MKRREELNPVMKVKTTCKSSNNHKFFLEIGENGIFLSFLRRMEKNIVHEINYYNNHK
jgi:hypothetical protein